MRFLLDMPVTPRAVDHLVAAGHDATHIAERGLATAGDVRVLALARAEGRVVVTADLDYPRLLALAGDDSPGVVLFRGGSFSDAEMLHLLDRVLAAAERLDLERSITVIDRDRVRRRRLPVVSADDAPPEGDPSST